MSKPLSKLRNSLLRVSQGVLAAPDFHKRYVFKRFFKCQNTPYIGNEIEISYSAERKSAHYGNIIHCGSVWLCPDCSAKISVIRCGEMQAAISNWTKMDSGNAVYMLTLTHSHSRHDALSSLMANQSEALQRFGVMARFVVCWIPSVTWVGFLRLKSHTDRGPGGIRIVISFCSAKNRTI